MKIRKKGVRGEGLLQRGKRVSSLWSQINYRIEVISWTAQHHHTIIIWRCWMNWVYHPTPPIRRWFWVPNFQNAKDFARRYHLSLEKNGGLTLKKTGNMFINHQNNKEPINVIMRYINLKKARYIHNRYSYVRLHL